jgi:hypothetical protein
MAVCSGLFKTDKQAAPERRTLQLLSRFTWELPNTALGFFITLGAVLLCPTMPAQYYHSATFVKLATGTDNKRYWAFTIGPFIVGSKYSDPLLRHEYGHYLQSRVFGLFYLIIVALPSLFSAAFMRQKHNSRWYEADANMRAKKYFEKKRSVTG